MRETRVWQALCKGCRTLGALCEKWESPNRRGPPDAIVTPPGIPVEFVETKRPDGELEDHQVRDHRRRRVRGHRVFVVYTLQQVADYVTGLELRIKRAHGGKLPKVPR